MLDDKLQEAFYIRDMIYQRNQLIYAFSEDNLDNLWTDCADGLPESLSSELDPTYLQLLIGMDNLLKKEDCPEEEILRIKSYISDLVDERLEETVFFLKKRVELINGNIEYLKKKYKKDWSITYEEALVNNDIGKTDNNNFNIDEILDKINERGMSSLTKDEKRFLKSKGKDDKGDDENKEK